MLTETEMAEIRAQVDRELEFLRKGVPLCARCKGPDPWDFKGQCRYCGTFKAGRRTKPGIVYVLRCAGYVKIGMTYNMEQRLRLVQSANPFPVVLLASFSTWQPHRNEQALHRLMKAYRHQGEWYRVDREAVERLAAACARLFKTGVSVDTFCK